MASFPLVDSPLVSSDCHVQVSALKEKGLGISAVTRKANQTHCKEEHLLYSPWPCVCTRQGKGAKYFIQIQVKGTKAQDKVDKQ